MNLKMIYQNCLREILQHYSILLSSVEIHFAGIDCVKWSDLILLGVLLFNPTAT